MTTPTTPSPERKEVPVAGAFLRMESETDARAPAALGGQTLEEQQRIGHDYAKSIGVKIFHEFIGVSTADDDTPDARIARLLEILKTRPVRQLLVPRSLYQRYTDDETMKHAVMLMLHGTELIFVED